MLELDSRLSAKAHAVKQRNFDKRLVPHDPAQTEAPSWCGGTGNGEPDEQSWEIWSLLHDMVRGVKGEHAIGKTGWVDH